jgi:hypothetical protein
MFAARAQKICSEIKDVSGFFYYSFVCLFVCLFSCLFVCLFVGGASKASEIRTLPKSSLPVAVLRVAKGQISYSKYY